MFEFCNYCFDYCNLPAADPIYICTIKHKDIAMKTLFNQHQNAYPLYNCRKSTETRTAADIQQEKKIAEQFEAINRSGKQPKNEELSDLMNYYLSVAG